MQEVGRETDSLKNDEYLAAKYFLLNSLERASKKIFEHSFLVVLNRNSIRPYVLMIGLRYHHQCLGLISVIVSSYYTLLFYVC